MRLRLKTKERPRGASSPLELASETITTGASCPWNLSTVPTLMPLGTLWRSVRTWALYGVTTRTSSSVSGRVTPVSSVYAVPSSSAIAAATSSASSRES